MIDYDEVKEKISEFVYSLNKDDFEDNYVEFIKGSYCFGIPFTRTFGVQKYEYKDGTPFYEIDIDDLRQTDYEAFLRTEEKEDVASWC